jgi:hypothetical protein
MDVFSTKILFGDMSGILMYLMRSAIVFFAYGFYGRVDFEAPDKVSVDLSLLGEG